MNSEGLCTIVVLLSTRNFDLLIKIDMIVSYCRGYISQSENYARCDWSVHRRFRRRQDPLALV